MTTVQMALPTLPENGVAAAAPCGSAAQAALAVARAARMVARARIAAPAT